MGIQLLRPVGRRDDDRAEPSPVPVPGLTGVVAMAAGGDHSLALKSDGTVWAWGDNYYGQLGDGTTTNQPSPVQVPGLTGVIAVAAGYSHSLAVKNDGTVWAWGYNATASWATGRRSNRTIARPGAGPDRRGRRGGRLGPQPGAQERRHGLGVGVQRLRPVGRRDRTQPDRSSPVQVPGLTGVVAVAAGYYHSLALKGDGTVWAWGYNYDGQLGDGTTTRPNLHPFRCRA